MTLESNNKIERKKLSQTIRKKIIDGTIKTMKSRDERGRFIHGYIPSDLTHAISGMKGKKQSDYQKRIISERLSGRVLNDVTKEKISIKYKGISLTQRWGKEKAKKAIEQRRQKIIGTKQSQEWINKRLPYISIPCSEQKKEKIRLKQLGKHISINTEFKMGHKLCSGKKHPMYGKTKNTYPPLMDISKQMIKRRKHMIIPVVDTKIEVKIQNFLTQLKIEYFTHKYINIKHNYQCDIFIPIQEGILQKTIIECDGDYWHGNPLKYPNPTKWQKEQIEEDNIRTKELKEKGFRVIRLWENEILQLNLEEFTQKCYNIK
jgi:G:T-mismatch repair DNA endonuclease (very short patch repair protein)